MERARNKCSVISSYYFSPLNKSFLFVYPSYKYTGGFPGPGTLGTFDSIDFLLFFYEKIDTLGRLVVLHVIKFRNKCAQPQTPHLAPKAAQVFCLHIKQSVLLPARSIPVPSVRAQGPGGAQAWATLNIFTFYEFSSLSSEGPDVAWSSIWCGLKSASAKLYEGREVPNGCCRGIRKTMENREFVAV